MVFTPNRICRFFFVTYHYCYLYPSLSYCRYYCLLLPLLALSISFSALSLSLSSFPLLTLSPLTPMASPLPRSSSLPPPSPKSPPEYPDLYGKRRETARVQMLEREISFLEEELKSVEGLQPASRCCKEMADFVVANSDPLLPTNKKKRRSCRFWKWLCGMPCFNLSWLCCCCCDCEGCCSMKLECPRCFRECKPKTCCRRSSCIPSLSSCCCCIPKWPSCCSCKCSCPKSDCCKHSCSCRNCCIPPSCCSFQCVSCPSCCTCKCSCSCTCPSCPKVKNPCSCCCSCTKSCFNPCSLSCCC